VIDAPPVIGEIGAIRQTVIEQNSQFLSLERVERFVRVRPPPNGPPRKTTQAQPVASAVIGEDFEGSPGTIAENEHNARERILIELPFAQGGERVTSPKRWRNTPRMLPIRERQVMPPSN
jgi:hypothetical protein